MIGVNPKQFFTLREGDTAYTLQWGSNSFGQCLSMTELKVGGLQRSIIIPAGKLQQGWKDFVIELRRMLEPSHYALGGLKFVLFIGKFQSFVLVNVFPPPPRPPVSLSCFVFNMFVVASSTSTLIK